MLMSSKPNNAKERKLEQLRAALDHYERHGSDLFDHQAEDAKRQVRHRALLLLDQRARSRHELQERLVSLDFDIRVIADVLDELEQSRLVNDHDFAMEWVRQRHELRGKSRSVLDQELQRKGISPEHRAAALEQVDDDAEYDCARELAMKKARQITKPPADYAEQEKYLRRIVGVLARRGFASGMSFAIAKEALEQRIAELS
jgi:recX family